MTAEPQLPFAAARYPAIGDEADRIRLDLDCCERRNCPQRDWSRAVDLTLRNLQAAYASMHLLMVSSLQLWNSDHEGHTEGCQREGCVFARDLNNSLADTVADFERVVTRLFENLLMPACDLRDEWRGFHNIDRVKRYVSRTTLQHQEGQITDEAYMRLMAGFFDVWRLKSVMGDHVDFVRYFGEDT